MTEEEKQKEIAKIRAARQPLPKPKRKRIRKSRIIKKVEGEKIRQIEPIIPREIIPYFLANKEWDEAFNQDVALASRNYDDNTRRALKNLILGYRDVVLRWDYPMARAVLNIADMEIQKMEVLEQFKRKAASGEKNISRNDTEMIKQLGQATKDAKKDIGIDPENLRNKGDGSLAETVADLVERGNFDKRRFVCKVVIGEGKAKNIESSIGVAEFKNVSNEDVDEFLQKATN